MLELFPWLIALALVALAWWSAVGAKAAARRAAQSACRDAEVRFIDELSLKRLTIARSGGRGTRWAYRIRRVYGFEFYWGGGLRYAGEIIMYGQQVSSVQLDPYPM
ncbi:MAG: DUF3301 domain-containing protein [Salinisphaera sp.]|nr:DUF3301 domain-containing protein [Salinisphaera sp.]